jgi:biopolymer transport protein ExbD
MFERDIRRPNDEERILPLVNVVFLLLIFFMLAGRLSATDPLRVEPPSSASQGMVGQKETVVSVGADGRLAFDGVLMDAAALRAAVAERVTAGETPRIRLRADGRAEAIRVVAVMETLREAGIERLRLLTIPGAR